MGNRTRVVDGLKKQLEDAHKQISILQKENSILQKDKERMYEENLKLNVRFGDKDAEIFNLRTSLDTMHDRDEAKQLELLHCKEMAMVNDKTIKELSRRVRSILGSIIRRGKIRSKHSVEYRAVRDSIFANYKVGPEMVVDICKRGKTLNPDKVIAIVEEIQEKEFTQEEREKLLFKTRRSHWKEASEAADGAYTLSYLVSVAEKGMKEEMDKEVLETMGKD